MPEDYVEGEMIGVVGELTEDLLSKVQWRMRGGELIYVKDMQDSHIRNTVLFLTGFGYTRCKIENDIRRVMWLKVFRLEWERRIRAREATGQFMQRVR